MLLILGRKLHEYSVIYEKLGRYSLYDRICEDRKLFNMSTREYLSALEQVVKVRNAQREARLNRLMYIRPVMGMRH